MQKFNFYELVQIMERLRSEAGCPWDKEQTHESLCQYLLEESYEVIDAINKNDMPNLCEELGDVLLQIVFHSQLEKEKDVFDINDVITNICKKMIARHPHVFSDVIANTTTDVLDNWEEIKKEEKGISTQADSIKNIPIILPALLRSYKVLQKASALKNMDLPDINLTFDMLLEQIENLKTTILNNNSNQKMDHMENIGDILLCIVNLLRIININPEFALTNATEKFINKFEIVEKAINNINI